MPHCQAQRCRLHGNGCWHHCFRLHSHRAFGALFAALRGNGCVAFRQCSQLPVFYFYRCRITAAPGNGFIRHIFGQYGGIQYQRLAHFQCHCSLIQQNISHCRRLYRHGTACSIATICRLHGDGCRPGRHCLQATVLIYRYHAVIAAVPGHTLVSRIFGVQFCYQLTGRTCCQLQSGLIQRYTLHRHLAHLTNSFCSRSGIATVNAVDIVPNAIGQ